MKIAIITDTHYNFKKANKNFHDYFAKFYNNIFFPYLDENNIKVVFHLGDAFDNRKGIDYWALKWAKENVYDKFKNLGITVYNIVGNHDTYYKNTNKVNSVDTLLEEYDNVIKISSPKEFTVGKCDFLMMPWICADNQEEVFSVIDSTKAKVALGHLELSDFPVFPGQLQPHGMDKKIFQKFDRVFTGHYHTRSDDGKIFYVGNPYQMFWNDVDDKRGFNIFDTESYELTHIENPFTIFKKLYYEDTEVKDLDISELHDKIVKLIVNKKSNQKKFDKYLDKVSSAKYIELKITELLDVDDSNFQESEYDVENTLVFLDKYIDESEFDLDKGIIKKIIKDVYIEALEIE
jgi:DNA repair exonuclease SbcCD nuclease subunit